ncbi:MAG TPA: 50S ribosomal protein L24 [Firmicutes bacterium]|nr:50S ribosomal protein L24 [Bacillota bacterium]
MVIKAEKKKVPKLRIKKDDNVFVLAGKDRGATGKVLEVDPVKGRATVEGINIVKRHKKQVKTGGGGINDMPAPLNVSNLVVICPHCKGHIRPGKKTIEKSKGGRSRSYHVRVCRKCGEQLDQV